MCQHIDINTCADTYMYCDPLRDCSVRQPYSVVSSGAILRTDANSHFHARGAWAKKPSHEPGRMQKLPGIMVHTAPPCQKHFAS